MIRDTINLIEKMTKVNTMKVVPTKITIMETINTMRGVKEKETSSIKDRGTKKIMQISLNIVDMMKERPSKVKIEDQIMIEGKEAKALLSENVNGEKAILLEVAQSVLRITLNLKQK